MSRPRQGIAQRLNAAQLAIVNSLSDLEIKELVGSFGYTVARLEAGRALYEAALAAVNAGTAASGGQQASTQALAQAEKSARDAYQSLAQVARAVFGRDKAQLAALGLSGSVPKDTAGFVAAAYTLFDNVRTMQLAEYGYDVERLESERAKIAAYDESNLQQESAKGAAQQATREQDSALQALDDWTAQYLKIAKVALRGKKQLLEKIGVAARTSKTAAQRAAPRAAKK
ncbi:MAG: hypothetical protein HY865_18590 [Chloroflexi bacterium]|nr:hypothetical protein [Chloroflexota bacterium]